MKKKIFNLLDQLLLKGNGFQAQNTTALPAQVYLEPFEWLPLSRQGIILRIEQT